MPGLQIFKGMWSGEGPRSLLRGYRDTWDQQKARCGTEPAALLTRSLLPLGTAERISAGKDPRDLPPSLPPELGPLFWLPLR